MTISINTNDSDMLQNNNIHNDLNHKAIAWTIAGSDSGGSAGIQADLHTFKALGVHGCSVITAITAQNSVTIDDIFYLPASLVQSQLSALINDMPAKAIKFGMLGDTTIINIVRDFLHNYSGMVVLDPVLKASSGKTLFSTNLSSLKSLFPYVDLLTPNLYEAELLLNSKLETFSDIENAASQFLSLGVKSVLLKGGHLNDVQFSQDFWTNGKESFWLSAPRIPTSGTHGTGCTLASAVTACLALGYDMKDALVIGKMYVTQAIRHAINYGQGLSSLTHRAWPENQKDLPFLSSRPITKILDPFPDCGSTNIGLYPVIDSVDWLKRLLPLGVSTIQLRIKNKSGRVLENDIQQAIQLANHYQARLFVNDYWESAIQYGAYGVHLGQDDLHSADLHALRQAGIRLGISTHCYHEIARAHTCQPSYIACGPIFPTTSKIMPFSPQGVSQLARWTRTLTYPIVAIGGINLERIASVLATHVDGIAMISAITHANNPESVAREMMLKSKR